MLALTRSVGQVIRIGDEIIVTVVAVKGGRCRLGISVRPEIQVRRQETMVPGPINKPKQVPL